MSTSLRLALAVVLLPMSSFFSLTAPAAEPGESRDGLAFTLADDVSYDDNLFRLPEGLPVVGGRRADWVNRATAAAVLSKAVSLQQFDLSARVSRNDYLENDDLNNTSGAASLGWQWQVGDRLDGTLGGSYSRELAGFTNNRFLDRDPIETTAASGSARLRILRGFSLTANARRNDTTHGVEQRRFDDLTLDSGGFGVEYRTAQNNLLAWEYLYSKGDYSAVQGFDRDFEENYSGARWGFDLRNRFRLEGSLGYAKREAAGANSGLGAASEYSGMSGRGSLAWVLGAKTRLVFEGWRELRAYADAESDYFVAKGGAIRPEWQATAKIELSAELSRQQLDFLGSPAGLVNAGAPRQDTVDSAQVRAQFAASSALAFTASLRHESRTSNRADFGFRDNVANIGVRFTF
jgi:putative beta-barrel porin BBP2